MSISEKFVDNGVPYYRGQDIHSFFIEGANPIRIDKDTFNLPVMKRSHLKKGDVLLSIVGTIGKLGLVTTSNKATCSCKLAILRPSKIIAEYLSVFLSSKYGQNQIKKFTRGAVQMGLILEDFDQLLVPFFDKIFQSQIETLVKNAHSKLEQSKSTYAQAENLLLNALGISDFSPSTKNTTEKSFKDSFVATGRLDAEYYQPKFDELEAEIAKSHQLAQLKDFLTLNQRGTQPNYAEQGLPVINSKHVREGEVLLTDNRFAGLSEKEEPLFIKKGDVLINGTGVGTIGRAACYLHEQNALPDNHVTILRTDKINPVYLSVYLNSIAGKYQVDKYFKGSSGQIELYPKDIENFYIPLINEDTQTQIANLVQQSFTLKAESERLLEMAKRAVETAIETDEQTAMAYINAQTGEQKP
jgi:restriction endonuclease S subunit